MDVIIYERKDLPMNNNVTIVTGLWDLGRNKISDSFKRSYDQYLIKFAELLKTPANMIIYISAQDEDFIWAHRSPDNTYLRIRELDYFETDFEFFSRIQFLKEKPEWYEQAGWLKESPQATLSHYNPVVLSKMFMLNDASLYNPFGSEYFYWIDAGIANTVHPGYFYHDMVFDNLEQYSTITNSFVMLSYPYADGDEIHGFPRRDMELWCKSNPQYVCRGGFFGGHKKDIHALNGVYYNILKNTLDSGLMGTEESIFTIMSHDSDLNIHTFALGDDGMVWPFFEQLKNIDEVKAIPRKKSPEDYITNFYMLSFNSPEQFNQVCRSIVLSNKEMFTGTRRILINNSTDESTFAQYDVLCELYGFEEIHRENLGICGGRQFAAEHAEDSEADFSIFFEDDMLLNPPSMETEVCSSGFRKYVPDLYKTIVEIMIKHNYDFLKFSFSEFYLNNNFQVAWYNVPQSVRSAIWPDYDKLPQHGFDMNSPRTKFSGIETLNGVPYASGEIYYGNWPQIVSRAGNKKMFLDTKWARPYEQTWMSHIFQLTLNNKIAPAILLASPITHNRFEFYKDGLRKES